MLDAIIWILGPLTVLILIFLLYHYVFGRWLAPLKTAQARVVRKTDRCKTWVNTEDDRLGREGWFEDRAWEVLSEFLSRLLKRPIGPIIQEMSYYVEVQVAGKRIEFTVSEEQYASVSEGDEGLLTYKGNKFVRFRNNTGVRTDLW